MKHLDWVKIPAGQVGVGSTPDEADQAFEFWKDKLLDASYVDHFRSYLMKEVPVNTMDISSFNISETLVTNKMYQSYIEETNARVPESIDSPLGKGEDYPVWGVSFDEANHFCTWLSEKMNCLIGIPNEAEWEYAARGSTRNVFPWGNDWNPEFCNTFETGIGRTTSVRQMEQGRSYFGLFDMGGNVEEWVDTVYKEHPGGQYIEDDIHNAIGPNYKILKGGSFARGGDLCRVSRRHGPFPDPVFRFTGFRIVQR